MTRALHGLMVHGLMAEFDSADALLAAARRARAEGYRRFDAYSPVPIEGLGEAIGVRTAPVAWLTLAGGLVGGGGGLFMQWYANVVSFPLDIGGRALAAWPAFALPAFELAVLGACLAAAVGMLALNGLPRLHHPVFEVPRFALAQVDRFFLCIEAADPRFDRQGCADFLAACGALRVTEVPA